MKYHKHIFVLLATVDSHNSYAWLAVSDGNTFEDYFFFNAYLERSSTTRHEYANIVKESDGSLSFKLNFQVRLK